MTRRGYLDRNATAPLLPEARAAMIAAMDVLGNPSSIHAEGRAARALVENARADLAEALGLGAGEIVFTSGATEAAALAMRGRDLVCADVEHDAVRAWARPDLTADAEGRVCVPDPGAAALQAANSETGVLQDLVPGLAVVDFVQAVGKVPVAFGWTGARAGLVSAHKFGGPKGIGALLLAPGEDPAAPLPGGGQERGRRSGTENIIGIAGFAAAARAAMTRLADGLWEPVAQMRDRLEAQLRDTAPGVMIAGAGAARLPNTTTFALPGWKGETQVMQMQLAGFAVSAGSACSSGKVRASRTLRAMGWSEDAAGSAIRVSLGPETRIDEIDRFAEAWAAAHRRFRARGSAQAA
ncbi:MAG: cysteine desulfurase [Rhodobacteraceae bacterium]|nr:cysteine desulfurase [Paracoccaceae bacterium]